MTKKVFVLSVLLVKSFCLSFNSQAAELLCPRPWLGSEVRGRGCRFSMIDGSKSGALWPVAEIIRSGYIPENPNKNFRGNIIFIEGFGDSMLNHAALFDKLADAGFRLIAFDFLGQGGSSGILNQTSMAHLKELVKEVWRWHARTNDLTNNRTNNRTQDAQPRENQTRISRPIVLGWSLGGLIGYMLAKEAWPREVILIAPTLAPRIQNGITPETLTSLPGALFSDPPRPRSHYDPTAIQFVADYFESALYSRMGLVPRQVRGLVLLTGENDEYLDSPLVNQTLRKNARHFDFAEFPTARHFLDNERVEISSAVRSRILQFLEDGRPSP